MVGLQVMVAALVWVWFQCPQGPAVIDGLVPRVALLGGSGTRGRCGPMGVLRSLGSGMFSCDPVSSLERAVTHLLCSRFEL